MPIATNSESIVPKAERKKNQSRSRYERRKEKETQVALWLSNQAQYPALTKIAKTLDVPLSEVVAAVVIPALAAIDKSVLDGFFHADKLLSSIHASEGSRQLKSSRLLAAFQELQMHVQSELPNAAALHFAHWHRSLESALDAAERKRARPEAAIDDEATEEPDLSGIESELGFDLDS